MDWSGWAIFGFAATVALTGIIVGAQLAGLTRLDIPLMLGTFVVHDPDRARFFGFLIHLGMGQFFAIFYVAAFSDLGWATWWLGALFGGFHGVAALTLLVPLLPGIHPRMASERGSPELDAALEPPGLFALNYGTQTAWVTLVAHVVYGAILGLFLDA
jgi:uncharacterized membrane protein YagU involved in acid resistance